MLGVLRRVLSNLIHAAPVAVARLLPASTQVRMRMAIRVIRRLDYRRRAIWLHVDSPIEQEVRAFSCAKEPETIRWIEETFRAGEVFYDVGANVGAYSLVAWAFLDGRINVYAFEPAIVNFINLCRNIALNRCGNRIVPVAVALSDRTIVDDFQYQTLEPGSGLHALGAAVDFKGEAFTPVMTQPVLAFRLDEFVHQFRLPAPHHIKIDVDGTELEVLRGADRTLANPGLRSILVELRSGTPAWEDAIRLLTERGFRLDSQVPPDGGVANHIFHRSQ